MDIDLLVFDVFGTVVDWRGSIIVEGQTHWKSAGLQIDWGAFADQWRAGYQPAMDEVRSGAKPWRSIDMLHREILDALLADFGLTHLSERQKTQLNRVWHRLHPWPDVRTGIDRLRERYVLTTLSNGNMSLLVNLSKNAELHWDCILSAELAQRYKPDLATYNMVCRLLDVPARRALMVASHAGDLLAAQKIGMHTAFVRRPLEYGDIAKAEEPVASFDLVAADFLDLDQQLT